MADFGEAYESLTEGVEVDALDTLYATPVRSIGPL